MTPYEKRAIAESKKPENQNVYVVAMKSWGRYIIIPRKTKSDAAATHLAAMGYHTAVARNGVLVLGSMEKISDR